MSDDPQPVRKVSLTAHGVEFAPWRTPVANDDLYLGRLLYDTGTPVYADKEIELSLPPAPLESGYALEATFVSVEKRRLFRFGWHAFIAFRVLDENGLVELWAASAATPRPARSTFRVRGHQWAEESILVFLDSDIDRGRYSYIVATDDLCLEVVSDDGPDVTDIGPALVKQR